MRAGFGQYTTDDKVTRRELTRMWFLQAAVNEAPQMAPSLYGVYAKFQRLGFQFDLGTSMMTRFICCHLEQLVESNSPAAVVRRAVEHWAGTFNLTTNGTAPKWVLQFAVQSCSMWQHGGPVENLASPGVSAILPPIDYSITIPELTPKHWNPFAGLARKQFEKSVHIYLRSVKSFVHHRLDEIESEAKAAGCKPSATNVSWEHYAWTARYQVAGIEVSEFRERFGLHAEPRGIRHAIREVLDDVGLTRRPAKNRGRPKKKKFPIQK